jgi:sensor histidine kinase YesM
MRSNSYTILIHVLVWVAFLLVPLIFIESATGRERFMIIGWFQQLLMATYFYYNFFWLIPRFLLRKKGWTYTFFLIIGLLVICGLNVAFALATAGVVEHRHAFSFWRTATFPIYPSVLAFALSTSVRITMEWFRNERQKKEMEAEKLTSELAFLKSQVNPHFLFNILNNICSLARKKSDQTEDAIIRLSQIMRYMLQDSKDEKVNLEREVDYLQSYIELQRLRLPDMVKIEFLTEGRPELLSIEPLLLIPFVENAFKHGVSYLDTSEISIRLICQGKSLVFRVDNTFVKHTDDMNEQGSGIGLKNVMRRLELLYPGRHILKITEQGNHYHVDLTLNF